MSSSRSAGGAKRSDEEDEGGKAFGNDRSKGRVRAKGDRAPSKHHRERHGKLERAHACIKRNGECSETGGKAISVWEGKRREAHIKWIRAEDFSSYRRKLFSRADLS
jgi:hypothetical protein